MAGPAQGEAAREGVTAGAGGQIREPLAEQRPELEPVPGRSAADHDAADPVHDEILIRAVVIDAALAAHQIRAEAGQVPARQPGQLRAQARAGALVLAAPTSPPPPALQAALVHRPP